MSKAPPDEIARAAELLRDAGRVVTPPPEKRFGCFCDLSAMDPGTKPDGCVIDEGRRQDCIYARQHKRKEQCEYWKAWTPESLAGYWAEIEKESDHG